MRFQNSDADELFIRRLKDMVRTFENGGRTVSSDFLTPYQQKLTSSYLGNRIEYKFVPDFPETLAKCLVIGIDERKPIVCLIGDIKNKFVKITHRDIYGVLMSLGLEKNKFGDIWVDDNQAVIYCKEEIANYVCQNAVQVNRLSLELKIEDDLMEPVVKTAEKRIVVSSLRLDVLVSKLANISRLKSQEMIKTGLVHLNYNNLVDSDDLCSNSDIISIRRVGRFKLLNIIGETKKGSIAILVAKYI
jgi:Uncharacterized conserved protein, contains S4-like domain